MLINIRDRLFYRNLNKVGLELTSAGIYPETFTYLIEKRKSVYVWDVIYKGKRDICICQYFGAGVNELQFQPVGGIDEIRAKNFFDLYLESGEKHLQVKTLDFCSRCGRLLTDSTSIQRGYGPECMKETERVKRRKNV